MCNFTPCQIPLPNFVVSHLTLHLDHGLFLNLVALMLRMFPLKQLIYYVEMKNKNIMNLYMYIKLVAGCLMLDVKCY